jgi:uracil-DNA glycosylase
MNTESNTPPGFPATIPCSGDLAGLHEVMTRCTRCDLSLHRTQVVPGDGDPRASLFFLGEAPGATEDRLGIPFVGASGRLLDAMLAGAGLRRPDVFIANVGRCRPPENRNPRAREVAACSGWLARQLALVRPRVVVPLGRFALHYFLPEARITRIQATVKAVVHAGEPLRIFPLLHPAAILRNPRLRDAYQGQFRELARIAEESGPDRTSGPAPPEADPLE